MKQKKYKKNVHHLPPLDGRQSANKILNADEMAMLSPAGGLPEQNRPYEDDNQVDSYGNTRPSWSEKKSQSVKLEDNYDEEDDDPRLQQP